MSEQPMEPGDTLSQDQTDNHENINRENTSTFPLETELQKISFNNNELNIVTHNIRGMSKLGKIHDWIDYCVESNFHIIALTETKLTTVRAANLTNPLYSFFTSNFEPPNQTNTGPSLGTALMVCSQLQPYVHTIQTLPGTLIYIDFYFPGNKTRIISTYLPSATSHPQLNKQTQERATRWFREAKNKNWHVILLGDLNANMLRDKKLPLFKNLQTLNATSLLSFYHITTPTWANSNTSSQIDDIWVTPDMIQDIDQPIITDADYITDSDHKIIQSTWHIEIFKQKTPRNKKKKRKIYQYAKMTKENWENFATEVDTALSDHNHVFNKSTPWNSCDLNKAWHIWSATIKRTINKHIPYILSSQKKFNGLSLKATNLHLALKALNKCLRLLSTQTTNSSLEKCNKLLHTASALANLTIQPLSLADIRSTPTTISQLKQIKHTIWTARNLEKLQEQSKKIDHFVNRRYNDFKENTSRMIDSILKRRPEPVRTNKIILPDQIITNKPEVQAHIRSHFMSWTRKNPPDPAYGHGWDDVYLPLKNIDPTIYEPLTQSISFSELQKTIENAPKNKATGPLAISNEILQHLPNSALNALLEIFNNCMHLNETPKQWLRANIWPIPKRQEYKYDLSMTRPITLIDHTRKCFTKILTSRMTAIIMRNEILSPMNHAAFPHQSTFQPVSKFTHIIEDALTNNKEIWALSQDMSKAFDSVHIDTLAKALRRIKVPTTIINLLTYLLANRTNQVITDYGFTDSYPVMDGIDQGETFSPLLWKIYYDPLISTIQKKFMGYSSTIPTTPPKTINTSVMAYMDDALWIAPDKQTLTEILDTATSFYKLNNIKVNPTKSFLLTNSRTTPHSVVFDDTKITALPSNSPLKYLGTWFTLNKTHNQVQKNIIAEIQTNLKKLHWAKITEKQAAYIYNHVIVPRFQYRILSSYLKAGQLKTINRTIMNIIKQKAKLAKGVPNSFMTCASIYAITDISQAQLTTLTTNLLRGLNHITFDSSYLKIRLQKIQEAAYTKSSILEERPIISSPESLTHTSQAVLAIHELNINLTRPLNTWPIPTKTLGSSINYLLHKNPRSSYLKNKLNQHHISCIEQFLDPTNTKLLSWKELHHNIRKIPRGRTPKWFTIMQELIRDTTSPSLELIDPNPFITPTWIPQKKGWVITSQMEIAKIYNTTSTPLLGKHYRRQLDNTVKACTGCELSNRDTIHSTCYIRLEKEYIHNIQVDCHKHIHANIKDIKHSLQQLKSARTTNKQTALLPRPLSAFNEPPIRTWESLVSANFKKKELNITLTTSHQKISNRTTTVATCSFLPDGNTISSYSEHWPTKITTLTTLLSFVLSTTDNRAKIKITTNNPHLLTLISQTTDTHFLLNQKLDQMEWPLLQRITNAIIGDRKLDISFDKEKKTVDSKPPFSLNLAPHNFLYNRYTPLINSIPIAPSLKLVIKHSLQITNLLKWYNQDRIKLWQHKLTDIDWDATLATISFKDKPKALYTCPTLSNLKNFKVKLLAEELPTFLLLHFRNPTTYPNYLCPRCYSAPEDYAHLLTCLYNHVNLKTEINRILNSIADQEEKPLTNPAAFVQTYLDLHITQQTPIGLITRRTQAPFATEHLRRKLTPLLHHKIAELIYKEIWLPSRAARHSEVMPTPTAIPAPKLKKTSPPLPLQIETSLNRYINTNNFSPNNILII